MGDKKGCTLDMKDFNKKFLKKFKKKKNPSIFLTTYWILS